MIKNHIEIKWKDNLYMRGYHQQASTDTVVIVVHGIGGNKLGHKYIFKQFADCCALNQISSIRVDFIGSGESDGDFKQTAHSSQVDQVRKQVEYARYLGYKNIVLCSTTIGCYSLWHYAKTDNSIELVINWNPITDFKKYKQDQLRNEEENRIDLQGLELGNVYISDLCKLEEQIPLLSCNVEMIQGEEDYEFKFSSCKEISATRNWGLEAIPNGNHLFEGSEVRKQLFLSSIAKIKQQYK